MIIGVLISKFFKTNNPGNTTNISLNYIGLWDDPAVYEPLIKEYQDAIKLGAGPKIFSGSPEHRCGKIAVEFTGGTEGSPRLYQKMADAGVGTILGMHVSEEHKKEADAVLQQLQQLLFPHLLLCNHQIYFLE